MMQTSLENIIKLKKYLFRDIQMKIFLKILIRFSSKKAVLEIRNKKTQTLKIITTNHLVFHKRSKIIIMTHWQKDKLLKNQ